MAKHKCTACKIGSMKKKKHRVSGLGKADAGELLALGGSGLGTAIAINELKVWGVPKLTEGKTADEVIMTHRIVNGVQFVAGLATAFGGLMLRKKSPVGGMAVVGTGLGLAIQSGLSVWINDVKDQTLAPKLSGKKGWDAKAWDAERKKKLGMGGADNAGAGLAGADNAGAGVFGFPLKKPLNTMVDQIGNYRKKATASF